MASKKRVKPFNEKNLPTLIRLYKAGWTLAALKAKWNCYGNCLARRLLQADVYRKSRLSATPEYSIYQILRCECANGNRRAKFLFKSFDQFLNDVGPRPSNKHWIRKVDTNGHYAPGNVQWSLPHFKSGTTEYSIYCGAKRRCTNPKCVGWENYGGRGIQFRFANFEEFFAELGPRPSPAHSVDRIDNDGHYEAGNVRWATRDVQINNRRNSIKVVEEEEIPEAP